MSNLLKVSDEIQQQMLSDLCARNQPCELVFISSEGARIKAKVRFLHLSGQRLLIDLPLVSGRAVMIRPGEIIQLYFLWKEQRFLATSVIQARTQWQEGKSNALEALAIQYPHEIERAQRRECYRLSLAHLPSATMTLRWAEDLNNGEPPEKLWDETPTKTSQDQQEESCEETSPRSSEEPSAEASGHPQEETPEAPAEEAEIRQLKPLQGRMTNLSETGCGAVFEKDEAPPFERGHLYCTTFSLPDDPEPFEMTAEIKWTQDHPAGDRVMAGMAWQLDRTNRTDRAIQTRIARFITHEQREALRRARAE